MGFVVAGALGYLVGRTADQALADTLGLTTYRHGTDPLSWVKIHLFGATPESDLSQFGRNINKEKNTFMLVSPAEEYVFHLPNINIKEKIVEVLPEWANRHIVNFAKNYLENRITAYIWQKIPKLLTDNAFIAHSWVIKRGIMYGLPIAQRFDASFKQLSSHFQVNSKIKILFAACMTCLMASLTPNIKFRFNECNKDKISDIQVPLNFVQLAERKISILNIGLLGTLKNSIRLSTGCLSQPSKVLQGAAVLALTGLAVSGGWAVAPGFLAAHKIALIAGAIIACI